MPRRGTAGLMAVLVAVGMVAFTGPAQAAATTVTLTAPAANATVSGVITLDATVSSNTDKVEYFIDDVEVAQDDTNNGNWSEEWDTRTVADGSHELRAKATDGTDVSNDSRTITVANNTTPSNGLGAPTLSADPNGDKTVDLVWTPVSGAVSYKIYEDLYTPANGTTALATVTDTKSRRGPLAEGTYRYFVRPVAADGSLGTSSNKFTVTVPQPAGTPSVTFNTPATNATLTGNVNFTATCATTTECDEMDYLIDGQEAADDGAGDNADGFTETINTALFADGKHYIQARGHKGTVTLTTAPRAVTFSNGTTPPDEDPAPVANFTVTPVDADTFDFVDTSANSPTSWSWDFGDGSAAVTTQNAQHDYAAAGTYTVTLTATNAAGSDTASRSVTTGTDPPEEPTATDLRPSLPGTTGDNTMVDITAGEQVKFNGNWYVDNADSGGSVTIKWYVDGVERGSIAYLHQPVGSYGSESSGTWTATEGSHTVKMVVDPDNTIAESSETNNESTRAFTVQPAATPTGPPAIPASGPVPAKDETQAFASGTGDIADDPAIYVDPSDASRSVVFGSKKAASGGGIAVYDLFGNQLQFLGAGELNNVDVRTVGGKVVVVTTERGNNTLTFFYYDAATRQLTAAGSVPTGFEPYGACLYYDGTTLYSFVTNRNSPWDFDQYSLTAGASTVTGSKVRDLTTTSLSEGCVADDENGHVFLSQETSGIYRYSASPTGGSTRTTVATVGTNGLTADVEGISIARGRGATHPDHIVVSSQGASTYQVFDLASPFTFRKSFTVAANTTEGVDAVTGTDGLDITRVNLGSLYPNGLLVVHDETNTGSAMSNFKFVDAGLVLGAYDGAVPTEPNPNTGNRGPAGAVTIWEDDFESGLDCSIWERVQNQVTSNSGTPTDCTNWDPNGDGSRLSFPVDGGEQGAGDRYARFELRNGDVSAPGAGTGHRSEVSGDSAPWQFHDGDERWIQMRVRKDTSGMADTILSQFHAGENSPPLELGLDGTDLTLDSHADGTVPNTVLATAAEWPAGTWIDINLHVKWSQSTTAGGAEVFINGVRKTPWLAGRTMNTTSTRIYMKFGEYRGSDTAGTYVISYDDLRLSRN